MTVFLIFLFIGLLIFRIAAGFYIEKVPFFAALTTPLTWLCVGAGVLMVIFIAIKIYKELRHKND